MQMADVIRGRRGIFAARDVSSLMTETEEAGHELKRAVSPPQLTAMGIGAIIGTGILVVIGEGVGKAGPAVILSFALAAVACVFSALSYAELASSIPVSGSAYTYSYATLGEIVAWIIGWDPVLEYGVSVAAAAIGWGGNLNEFLDSAFGVKLPDAISQPREEGGIVNLPAVIIVVAITFLLVSGVRRAPGRTWRWSASSWWCRPSSSSWRCSTCTRTTSPRSRRTASTASPRRPQSCSSPISASTRCPPAARRPATRPGTCRSR